MKYNNQNTEQVIKQLFDNYFHQLVLSAFRYVNDYAVAEDIVQDVFVKVWQTIDLISSDVDYKAYLLKSVKNSSLNYIRHQKTKERFAVLSNNKSSETEKSVEDNKIDTELNKQIQEAVNKLPKHWREAIIRSKYDNLKYHEIAQQMNISQKTVEKYISKSLMFLRNELKDILVFWFLFLFHFFL